MSECQHAIDGDNTAELQTAMTAWFSVAHSINSKHPSTYSREIIYFVLNFEFLLSVTRNYTMLITLFCLSQQYKEGAYNVR